MTSTTGVKPERHTGELDLLRLYLDQVGRHPLLTRQDEVELSRAYWQAWTPDGSSPSWPPAIPAGQRCRPRPTGASGPDTR